MIGWKDKRMLDFRKKSESKSLLTYSYFVECNEIDFGVVSINTETGETTIESLAPSDKFKRYAFHLMRRLEKDYAQGTLTDDGSVVWY